MKSVLTLLALTALLIPARSQAVVREVANCKSASGKLQISVQDNQGIGPSRDSNLIAVLQDQSGNVLGSYPVRIYMGVRAKILTRAAYLDVGSKGANLTLKTPITDGPNFILRAKTDTGVVEDNTMTCSMFFGRALL